MINNTKNPLKRMAYRVLQIEIGEIVSKLSAQNRMLSEQHEQIKFLIQTNHNLKHMLDSQAVRIRNRLN